MNANPSIDRHNRNSDLSRGVFKRLLQVVLIIALQAALLFIAAGRLDWVMAWVYVGVYFVIVAANSLLILPRNPELVAERGAPKENVKAWDKTISGLSGLASLVALVIAGLDTRFAWSPPLALAIQLSGLVLLVLGYALFSWAMVSNPFFSTQVRIQTDRGHTVASAGPYRFVRHPGYVGWIIINLATPLLLGSPWALIPGGLSGLLMIVRTRLEDRTLQAELDGYKEYASRVRYRLLPGVW